MMQMGNTNVDTNGSQTNFNIDLRGALKLNWWIFGVIDAQHLRYFVRMIFFYLSLIYPRPSQLWTYAFHFFDLFFNPAILSIFFEMKYKS